MNSRSNLESAIAKPAKGHRECQYDSGISTDFRELPPKKEISWAGHQPLETEASARRLPTREGRPLLSHQPAG